MPILFVMVLVVSCLPVPWPEPPLDLTPGGSLLLSAGVLLLPITGEVLLSACMVRQFQRYPQRRAELIRQHQRYRRLLGLINIVTVAVVIVGCGWGWTVWHTVTITVSQGESVLMPGAELLVPMPYFLLVFVGWLTGYPVERVLSRGTAERGGDFPQAMPSLPSSLVSYLGYHFRQFLLLIVLPLTVFAGQQSLIRTAPQLAADLRFQAIAVAAVGGLVLILPRLVKPLLGLQPLPAGPIRERLEQTCQRLDFHYRELLLWPTRGAMANAMVLGIIPWARSIVLTDRLLHGLTAEELDAVLGHEIGHVAHGHIISYAVFFVLSATLGTIVFVLLEQALAGTRIDAFVLSVGGWMHLPPILGMTVYLFVVFGWLSRRCERQADLYGCRAASHDCWQHSTGRSSQTGRAAAGLPVCPAGVRAMIQALERVMILNGMDRPGSGSGQSRSRFWHLWAMLRAWQHGPLPDRIAFLQHVAENPILAEQTDRRITRQRRLLLAFLASLIVLLGSRLGWEEFWRWL